MNLPYSLISMLIYVHAPFNIKLLPKQTTTPWISLNSDFKNDLLERNIEAITYLLLNTISPIIS